MSKKKKSRRLKIKKNSHEGILVDLEKIARKPGTDREAAQSLVSWYLKAKFWTNKQKLYAESLIHRNSVRKTEKQLKYHLYAIGDGESIKLGVSTNIGKRLKSIQTGHPKKLSLLWRMFVGRERGPAYKAEKKLHRHCKKHLLRGEWFSADCMSVVNQFSLKERLSMNIEQKEHDIKLLSESPL